MAKSKIFSLCNIILISFLVTIFTTKDVICQGYGPYADEFFERHHHTSSNQFYSPFDAWRRNFPPSTDGSTQFWPNFHNFEPDFRNADPDSISSEERTEGPNEREGREPFEVDVISSGLPSSSSPDDPNYFFHHAIPIFESHPFFSTFGGFGFGRRKDPWWKGPNVCTERSEEIEEPEKDENNNSGEEMASSATTNTEEKRSGDVEILQKPFQFFAGVQFSVNSCIEKHHKHVCKQVYSKNGRKKTITVTHQCCHGYGRSRNAEITTPCEKIDLKSLIDTAEDMGAKEFIRSAKNNGLDEKLLTNVTLFLPTDSAFTEFSEQMFENNLVVLPLSRVRRAASDSSGITTKELALNHMVDGWINMEDIKNEELLTTNYDNSTIRINLFPSPPNNHNFEYPFRYTANCAPIVKINKITTNGIIHVVDKVLTPVTKSVMDIIRERNDMAVLRTILEKTKLSELLEGNKPVTIFAPTDKAFEKLDMHLRRTLKEGKGCATNILKNHILDLTFCSVAVVTDAKTTAYNLLGQAMSFERSNPDDGKTQDAEIADLTGIQDIIVNGQAKIIENDLMGTNGVVHVIDTIMPTDTALPITSLLEKKNLTIFKSLIEASGLQDEFDDLNNVTFFVPSDKAFDSSSWKQQLEENPDSLRDNKQLKEFLEYHVVEPMTKTCDLSEKKISTKYGPELRVNLYSTHALFSNVMNRATVNCARLVHFDDESCGSVLHQVDKLLAPPKTNLLETLESNPDYSMFLDLIKATNLTHLLEDNNQSFTLLTPKNDIFLEVEGWYKSLLENQNELEHLIKSHIVNEVVCCAGIIPTNWPFVRTIETIDNSQLKISRDRRPKIENAGVTKCDIIATNGILHEINDVINLRKRSNPDRHHITSFEDILF